MCVNRAAHAFIFVLIREMCVIIVNALFMLFTLFIKKM